MVDQIICLSYESFPMSPEEVQGVLDSAKEKNKQDGLNGALFYKNGFFLHVLEGELEKIKHAYEHSILHHNWHHKVRVLGRGFHPGKDFTDFIVGMSKVPLRRSHPDEIWNLVDSLLGESGQDLKLAKSFSRIFSRDIV